MGDYSEHVLFGLLTGLLLFYLFSDFLYLDFQESVWSVMMVLAGSVIPDIDHPNSYVRRSFQSLVSLTLSTIAFFLPYKPELRFLIGTAVFLSTYTAISRLRIIHRGFFHSLSFTFIISSLVAIASFLIVSSPLPGIALCLGILSHLILDREVKLT